MNEPDETKVIARALAGDQRAFERLIARWDGEVLNLACRLSGDLEEARDIRQMAFVKAYRGLAGFDGRCRFSTWLFRIVVNLCRDHARRQRSRRRLLRAAPAASEVSGRGVVEPPGQPAEAEELRRLVVETVMALPPAQREVLVLRHYHEIPLAEVSRLLEIPVTTARSRLREALTRLRARLVRGEPHPCHEGG